MNTKKCLWCLKSEKETTFQRKAHTIPLSLGGQNYNQNVCDDCNSYFGTKHEHKYSIEEALKEGFNITRQSILNSRKHKKKTGKFKSRFFEIKDRNGRKSLQYKTSFRFNSNFQKELCRSFKRGLYKMYFEELNRQKNIGYDKKYDPIRNFSRYNIGDPPVIYFHRTYGVLLLLGEEGATPILMFDRMKYLYSDDNFQEIEFLGHVFGFALNNCSPESYFQYIDKSMDEKKGFFHSYSIIEKFTDIDFIHSVMNQ